MKKMVEMDCCDICGKTLYTNPEYLEGYSFKDDDGNKIEAVFCEDCFNDRVVQCRGCGCYIRIEDVFSLNYSDYDGEDFCEQCAEQAIEEKCQELEVLKADLKDARAAFERRKAERE